MFELNKLRQQPKAKKVYNLQGRKNAIYNVYIQGDYVKSATIGKSYIFRFKTKFECATLPYFPIRRPTLKFVK